MSRKTIKYTEGDIGEFRMAEDFLPAPHELVRKEETVKVTLSLSRDSIDFFKEQSAKLNVPYQRMIRSLVDEYAEKHGGHPR